MAEHQQRGGPDATTFWNDEFISLGHNRLSIIDVSGGVQPMEGERFVLVFNGCIYNHIDLRKHEIMHWKSHSDTLTLLNLIEHKGIDWTLRNIKGMFSFAAYDKYEKKVYIAVDPWSIKPMFYTDDGFASSPGALTLLRDKWDLNLDAVTNMLALGATKDPLFDGMHRLPGGHMLKKDLRTGIQTISRYYTPVSTKCTEEELIEEVKQSIQSTKLSDVPIHIFLSGGIDSTVVASQFKNHNAVHLNSPELQYAKQVGEKYGNHVHVISPADFDAETCIADYCQQSGDCSAGSIIPYIVSKEVSKFGKVAISANGADETFGGYHRMFDTHQGQVSHIFRPIKNGWECNADPRLLELETYVQYDLNKTLDFASMCWGLEVRVPYLNKTVVEMALGIPREMHGSKLILKHFLEREGFDSRFVNRQKLGFSLFSQPTGYETLKDKGMELLNSMGFRHTMLKPRDIAYYRSIAGNFYVWYNTWKHLLTNSD